MAALSKRRRPSVLIWWPLRDRVRLRVCENTSRDTIALSQQGKFLMKRFVEGEDRSQSTLFPERLDDYIAEDNPVRVIDAFVDTLDLVELGFERAIPQETGRPGYHPATLLKIYIYGYLNRIQSSRRLERETQRNVEMMWLTGRLMPDFKTIADFRKDNGKAIRQVCREFIALCRNMNLFTQAIVSIDGSKFKAWNSKDRNDTQASMKRRIARVEQHIERYLSLLDEADTGEPSTSDMKEPELKEKLASLQEEMERLKKREGELLAHPDKQLSDTDPDSRLMKKGGMGSQVSYNVQTVVDAEHKLIVAHEVTNAPVDRNLLYSMAKLSREAMRGTNSQSWQTEGTTRAKRYAPATSITLKFWYPNRGPQITGKRDCMINGISSTTVSRMNTAARRTRGYPGVIVRLNTAWCSTRITPLIWSVRTAN